METRGTASTKENRLRDQLLIGAIAVEGLLLSTVISVEAAIGEQQAIYPTSVAGGALLAISGVAVGVIQAKAKS